MWLADCRIPFVDEKDPSAKRYETPRNSVEGMFNSSVGFKGEYEYKEQQGRFTPNLLVCDDMLNDGVITTAKANLNYKWSNTITDSDIFQQRGEYTPRNDSGSSSRYYDLDKWFDKVIEQL